MVVVFKSKQPQPVEQPLTFTESELPAHLLECPARRGTCQDCQQEVKMGELGTTHDCKVALTNKINELKKKKETTMKLEGFIQTTCPKNHAMRRLMDVFD